MEKRGMKMIWLTRLITITVLSSFTWSCTIKTTQRTIGAPDPIKIQDIRVAEGVDKTIIELESEEPILYTSFRLSDPDRLVIEMADVTFGQYQDEIKVSSGPVRSIMLASSGELDVSRLEFELNGLVKTEVRPDGLNIVVEVTRLEKMTGPIFWTTLGTVAGLIVVRVYFPKCVPPDHMIDFTPSRLREWLKKTGRQYPRMAPMLT